MNPALPRAAHVPAAGVNFVDGREATALHYAVGGGNKLSFLIERGAKLDVRDETGRTPLDYARRLKDEESIRILVAAGAR